jgi:tetratricopeptide (TPR) repeat protein
MTVAEATQAEFDPQKAWKAVKQNRSAGQLDAALALAETLAARVPSEFRYQLSAAELLGMLGRLQDAEPYLDRARQVGTDDDKALEVLERLRIQFLQLKGRTDEAIAAQQGLADRFPGDFRFQYNTAEMLVGAAKAEAAGAYLERARAAGAPDEKGAELLGRLDLRRRMRMLLDEGRPDEVIRLYHQAVREDASLMRKIEDWLPIVNGAGQALFQANEETVGAKALSIIAEVRERGIAIRHFDDIVGEPGLFAAMQQVVRETNDWTVPGKPHFFKAIREEAAAPDHPIMRAGLHPRLLEVANGFYALYTRLVSANIVLTKTDAAAERIRRGSEGWHRDPEDTPMFKAFIYLNDVLEVAHGPFQYIGDSRPGRKYEYLMPHLGRGVYDPAYKTKPDWEQTDRAVDPDDVVTVLGRAGTMFFCDTSAFHRGGYCLSQDRYMAAYVYQRPGSQFPSYVKAAAPAGAPVAVQKALEAL